MKTRATVLTGLVLAVLMLSMLVVPPTQATVPLSAAKADGDYTSMVTSWACQAGIKFSTLGLS